MAGVGRGVGSGVAVARGADVGEAVEVAIACAVVDDDAENGTDGFHDARHSVATFWLAAGVPARVVADMLGHSQVSLTLNVYTHVLPTLRRDAANRLDAILGN